MSRICSVCQKKSLSGNNRSKSNRATRRKWKVNIQKIRFKQSGKIRSGYVCTSCLKKVAKVI